ncbi:MAG: MFS transporter [Candidatus Caldarchaeum sp.]
MAKRLPLLFFGHLANDTLYTSLPPLLPLLAAQQKTSAATLALIPTVYMMTASFLQLAVGFFFDRKPKPTLVPLGLFLGGAAVSAIGFVEGYPLILLLGFLGGVGSALFHPPATSIASLSDKRSSSVSFFMSGGDIGLAVGSFLATTAYAAMGVHGTGLLIILPALAATMLLIGERQRVEAPVQNPVKPDVRQLGFALATAILRAVAALSFVTFLPLYLTERGLGFSMAGTVLTIMILAGAGGMLSAGYIAEKIGKRRAVSLFLVLTGLWIPVAVLTPPQLAFLVYGVLGFLIFAVHPLLVAYAHDLLPQNLGAASGLMYGLTFGLGHLVVPIIGAAVDFYGYQSVLLSLAFMPFTAALLFQRAPAAAKTRTIYK